MAKAAEAAKAVTKVTQVKSDSPLKITEVFSEPVKETIPEIKISLPPPVLLSPPKPSIL